MNFVGLSINVVGLVTLGSYFVRFSQETTFVEWERAGYSGHLRDVEQRKRAKRSVNDGTDEIVTSTAVAPTTSFSMGLLLCLVSGVMSPGLNFALGRLGNVCILFVSLVVLAFGDPIKQRAVAVGASDTFSSCAVWSLSVSAGFVVNALYCIHLLNVANIST